MNLRRLQALLLCLACSIPALAQNIPEPAGSTATSTACFIENKGQWPQEVRYKASPPGAIIWVTTSGIVFDYFKIETRPSNGIGSQAPSPQSGLGIRHRTATHTKSLRRGHVVRMIFDNANAAARMYGRFKQTAYHNYFLGSRPDRWASHVGLFSEAVIADLYEGIDARLYFEGANLRYDFIVRPGADPAQLSLRFEGGDSLTIAADGALQIAAGPATIGHGSLFAYQDVSGQRRAVDCSFTMHAGGRVKFAPGRYNNEIPLIIDPLVYSSYLGGSTEEFVGASMAVDNSGSAYLVSATNSDDYPTTPGAYEETMNDAASGIAGDISISKLGPRGATLIFSTFLGGSAGEYTGLANDGSGICGPDGSLIALGQDGSATLCGITYSEDFPTTSGALFNTLQGASDAFVVTISSDGSRLLYGTYFGGNAQDAAHALALDADGAVYIGGETFSAAGDNRFPTTPDAFQRSFAALDDLFIAKIDMAAGRLIYSTLISGEDHECLSDLVLDDAGNVYFCGTTASDDFPLSAGVFDTELRGPGTYDAFVAKLNADGSDLLYSSLLGGDFDDYCSGIDIDSAGCVYLTGQTTLESGSPLTPFPTTVKAFQRDGGKIACFVTKVSQRADRLVYSTFVAGAGSDWGADIKVLDKGVAFVGGGTNSPDFPTTSDALQEQRNASSSDAFICALNADGSALLYSTYLGGSDSDRLTSLALGESCGLYASGTTRSRDFPLTADAFDTQLDDGSGPPARDLFALKLNLLSFERGDADTSICEGAAIQLQGPRLHSNSLPAYQWTPTESLDDPHSPTPIARPHKTTTYYVVVTAGEGCEIIDSVKVCIKDRLAFDAGPDRYICANDSVRIGNSASEGSPPYSYRWSPSRGLNDPLVAEPLAAPEETTTYYVVVSDQSSCEKVLDTVTVFVAQDAEIPVHISGPLSLCEGDSVRLTLPQGFSRYQWSDGRELRAITIRKPGRYSATVFDANGCEFSSGEVEVTLDPLPRVLLFGKDRACRNTIENYRIEGNLGPDAEWIVPSGGSLLGGRFSSSAQIRWHSAGRWEIRVIYSGRCGVTSATMRVTVAQLPIADAGRDLQICAGDSVQLSATGGVAFRWTPRDGLNDPTIADPVTKPIKTTTYSVQVSSAEGCSSSASLRIEVVPRVSLELSGGGDICRGDSAVLRATGARSYEWSLQNGIVISNQAQLRVRPEIDTWYYVRGSRGSCSELDSIFVRVHNPPKLNIDADRRTICAGESIRLRATGAEDYRWTPSAGLDDPFSATPLATPSASTTYSVTGSDTNGCASNSSATITVAPPSTMTVKLGAPQRQLLPGDTVVLAVEIADIPSHSPLTSFRLRLSYDAIGLRVRPGSMAARTNFNGWSFFFEDYPADNIVELFAAGPALSGTASFQLTFDVFLFPQSDLTTALTIIDFASSVNPLCRRVEHRGTELLLSNFCLRGSRHITLSGTRFGLNLIAPNPVTDLLQIEYSIGIAGAARVSLFNTLGLEIQKLADRFHQEGRYELSTDAITLTPGVYFVQLQTSEFSAVRVFVVE